MLKCLIKTKNVNSGDKFVNFSEKTIYLAGGCFWGLEHLISKLDGVIDAKSGYANGTCESDANYETVCFGNTGFRETVKVTYNKNKISLEAILFIYFLTIDPTVKDRQGNDMGSQYQVGIFYVDEESKKIIERITDIERKYYSRFFLEIKPLENFYNAEEYHQNYLEKNPNGYCHISHSAISTLSKIHIAPEDYVIPSKELIGNLDI